MNRSSPSARFRELQLRNAHLIYIRMEASRLTEQNYASLAYWPQHNLSSTEKSLAPCNPSPPHLQTSIDRHKSIYLAYRLPALLCCNVVYTLQSFDYYINYESPTDWAAVYKHSAFVLRISFSTRILRALIGLLRVWKRTLKFHAHQQ